MFVASNFVLALARLVDLACWAYFWIIIARALLSWVSPDPYNPIVRFLHNATEAGSGKTKLFDTVAIIALNSNAPLLNASILDDEAERLVEFLS